MKRYNNVFDIVSIQELKPGDIVSFYGEENQPSKNLCMCIWNVQILSINNMMYSKIGTLGFNSRKIYLG